MNMVEYMGSVARMDSERRERIAAITPAVDRSNDPATEPTYRFTFGATVWDSESHHWSVLWDETDSGNSAFTLATIEARIAEAEEWQQAHPAAKAIPIMLTEAEAREWIDHLGYSGYATDDWEGDARAACRKAAHSLQRQLTRHTGDAGYDLRRRWAD